ncbi:MAG: hypothetical protein NC041_08750 [Bacteroides sp.]|nr:hypothetical protein [Prevotella sp.]MCM1408679.1 hypothetical protein [Treponema brennaborense]MCM1470540.1 hypothetical protein [Bacteroides sp.]
MSYRHFSAAIANEKRRRGVPTEAADTEMAGKNLQMNQDGGHFPRFSETSCRTAFGRTLHEAEYVPARKELLCNQVAVFAGMLYRVHELVRA